MYSKKWPLLTAILILVSLLVVACGEEVSDDPPGELPAARLSLTECSQAGAALTAKATTVSGPTASPNAGLRVDLPPGTRLFLSNTFPYALALPDGWEVKEAQSQGNIKGDLIIIKKSSNSGAYVTIISEKLSGTEDSKAFYEAKLKEATATRKFEYDSQPERSLGGVTAYPISYNTPAGQSFAYPVQSLQLLFAAQGRGWSVTFTASPNQAARYCSYFARMLDSWTFTGLVK